MPSSTYFPAWRWLTTRKHKHKQYQFTRARCKKSQCPRTKKQTKQNEQKHCFCGTLDHHACLYMCSCSLIRVCIGVFVCYSSCQTDLCPVRRVSVSRAGRSGRRCRHRRLLAPGVREVAPARALCRLRRVSPPPTDCASRRHVALFTSLLRPESVIKRGMP